MEKLIRVVFCSDFQLVRGVAYLVRGSCEETTRYGCILKLIAVISARLVFQCHWTTPFSENFDCRSLSYTVFLFTPNADQHFPHLFTFCFAEELPFFWSTFKPSTNFVMFPSPNPIQSQPWYTNSSFGGASCCTPFSGGQRCYRRGAPSRSLQRRRERQDRSD